MRVIYKEKAIAQIDAETLAMPMFVSAQIFFIHSFLQLQLTLRFSKEKKNYEIILVTSREINCYKNAIGCGITISVDVKVPFEIEKTQKKINVLLRR